MPSDGTAATAEPAPAPTAGAAPIPRPSGAHAAPIVELAFDRRAEDAARALADRVGGAPFEALSDNEQEAFLGDARAALEAAGVRQLLDRAGGYRFPQPFTVSYSRDELFYVAYYGTRPGGREFLGGAHLRAAGVVDASVAALLLGIEPDERDLIRSVTRVAPELAAFLEDEHLEVFLGPDQLHWLVERAAGVRR